MRRAYQRVVELPSERGYRQFECAGIGIIHVNKTLQHVCCLEQQVDQVR